MNKKGMEMTFQTIVYAALALFMLGVLIFVFSDQIGINLKFLGDVTSCESQGGDCFQNRQENMNCFKGMGCKEPASFCCIPENK